MSIALAMLGSAAAGAAGSYFNNLMAGNRETQGRQENAYWNEWAAEKQDIRQRALYNDLFSPKAQLKQIKEAGLSPSIMFADGLGGQGQTAPMSAGASGISPTIYGINPLEGAQIALLEAQTRNVDANTKTINGENERGSQEIHSLILENYGKGLANTYQEFQNTIAKIHADYEEAFTNANVRKMENEADNAAKMGEILAYQIVSSFAKSNMDIQDMKIHAREIEAKVRNSELEIPLKISENKLLQAKVKQTNAECQKIFAEIDKMQADIILGMMHVSVDSYNAETQRQFMKNIDQYWDDSINQIEKRLNFDRDKLDKEMRYNYINLLETYRNHVSTNFTNLVTGLIPN